MDSQSLYLQTRPGRLFARAAIPGAISMLASSLYSVFDSIFVGKYLGTTAFAALGLAMPVIVVNFALADLVGVGSSVPISILLGRGEDHKANNYFTCACLLIFFTALVSSLAMFFGAPWLLGLMGAQGDLLTLGVRYIRTYALFSPFIPMMFAMDNFLRICGQLQTSMFLNIFMSLGTVALEFLLIVGLGWGVEGAAVGTCGAMLVCVAVGMGMFARGKLQLRFLRPRFSGEMIRQIYRNGISTFLTNVAGRVFSLVMNVLLLRMGGEAAVAVYGVAITVCGIIEQVLYGIIDALQPAIGYNYGAARIDRVKAIEGYVLAVSAGVSLLGGAAIFAFPGALSTPFLEDLSLLPLSIRVLRITSFTYLVKWLGQAIQSLFMALERPMPAMAISVCGASAFPLALIPLLMPLGLDGLWWNYTASSLLTTLLAVILYLWRKKRLFAPEPFPQGGA